MNTWANRRKIGGLFHAIVSRSTDAEGGLSLPKVIDAETLKSTPVSIGLLILMVPILAWIWRESRSWHYDEFFTRAEANQHSTNVQGAQAELQKTLEAHIVEFRISRAQDRLDDLEEQLYFLERDQELGPTERGQDRIRSVEHEIEETQIYLDCLIGGLPNCQHLEPRRR